MRRLRAVSSLPWDLKLEEEIMFTRTAASSQESTQWIIHLPQAIDDINERSEA
jgi:hypothetical protein